MREGRDWAIGPIRAGWYLLPALSYPHSKPLFGLLCWTTVTASRIKQAAGRNPSANIERVLSQARVILLDWKRRSRGRAEEGGERNKGRFMCRREIAGLGHGWAQGPARSWFALVMAFVGDVVNRCIKSAERIRERVLFMKWLSQK